MEEICLFEAHASLLCERFDIHRVRRYRSLPLEIDSSCTVSMVAEVEQRERDYSIQLYRCHKNAQSEED